MSDDNPHTILEVSRDRSSWPRRAVGLAGIIAIGSLIGFLIGRDGTTQSDIELSAAAATHDSETTTHEPGEHPLPPGAPTIAPGVLDPAAGPQWDPLPGYTSLAASWSGFESAFVANTFLHEAGTGDIATVVDRNQEVVGYYVHGVGALPAEQFESEAFDWRDWVREVEPDPDETIERIEQRGGLSDPVDSRAIADPTVGRP